MERLKRKFKLAKLALFLMISLSNLAFAFEYSDFKVLSSDESGLSLVYRVPTYERKKVSINNLSYDLIEIDKSPLLKEKGMPQIPVRIIAIRDIPSGILPEKR